MGLPPPGNDPNAPGMPPDTQAGPRAVCMRAGGNFLKNEDSEGLASLARTGQVPSAQSLFDLGSSDPTKRRWWRWVTAGSGCRPRGSLVNVTEASLYHMKRSIITSKFSCNISWLPALNCLRLVNNELSSFKDIDLLLDSFGSSFHIDHLTIRDNPISASQTLLRAYVIVLLPNLKSFNDLEITALERSDCPFTLKPVIEIHNLAQSQQASLTTLSHPGVDRTAWNSFTNAPRAARQLALPR